MLRDKPTQTSQSAIGKVATNITGDSNSYDSHDINIYQPVSSGPHRSLTKTLMYKLLQIMISSTEPTGEDFPPYASASYREEADLQPRTALPKHHQRVF